jgi:type I restriction enzyme R subunit
MNTIQSEAQLEKNLIKQLQGLEYDFVVIKDEKELLNNLKKQLEIHNFKTLN